MLAVAGTESMWSIAREYLPLGLIAALVTIAATPVAMLAARRFDVMDHPDTFLKPHARPIPYLGGLAIAVGWALTMLMAIWLEKAAVGVALPMLLGGLAIALLGATDDIRHIAPKLRLALSAAIALGVLLASGIGMSYPAKLLPQLAGAPAWLAAAMGLSLGLFIVLGACNSTNLIDGLDGLCAGVKAIICIGFFLLALRSGIRSTGTHAVILAASIAMAGAALGFLVWNYNPARIFMGDAGSLLLGFNSGVLLLQFAESGRWPVFLAALLIFTVPVFDTLLAMYRRWNSNKPIFQGDRSHFYDQLVQRGHSVRVTGAICYAWTAVTVAVAWLVAGLGTAAAFVVFILFWVALGLLAYGTGFTHPRGAEGALASARDSTAESRSAQRSKQN